ncbi:E3 Ubiquitin-Protein Ligase Trim56 [Manis pentadactyla]|nr:E3 Ubiquitin-Protein Ligase Trim56 [Manis pentadactyla]
MKFRTSGQESLTLCLLLWMAGSGGGRRRWLLTVPMFVLSRTLQYQSCTWIPNTTRMVFTQVMGNPGITFQDATSERFLPVGSKVEGFLQFEVVRLDIVLTLLLEGN